LFSRLETGNPDVLEEILMEDCVEQIESQLKRLRIGHQETDRYRNETDQLKVWLDGVAEVLMEVSPFDVASTTEELGTILVQHSRNLF
jgi:hypothetical protein